MKSLRRDPNGVNAGSMADIAFLLLIFFLVTAVIPNDQGINRKLPAPCPSGDCTADLHERNVLEIVIGKEDQLLVEGKLAPLASLRNTVKEFIDNNGDGNCGYCDGARINFSSDHPKKAVIALLSNSEASYEHFIAVQNELVGAYYELRRNYLTNQLKVAVESATENQLALAREAYPLLISEAEIQ